MKAWTVRRPDLTKTYRNLPHVHRHLRLAAILAPASAGPPWVAGLPTWNPTAGRFPAGPATLLGVPMYLMSYGNGRILYLGRCGDDTLWC